MVLFFGACNSDPNNSVETGNSGTEQEEPKLTDEQLLDLAQRETFRYFWDFAEPNSGAARERYHPASPELDRYVVTSGGSGFGLMVLLVGMERGFISRAEGITRIDKILSFF